MQGLYLRFRVQDGVVEGLGFGVSGVGVEVEVACSSVYHLCCWLGSLKAETQLSSTAARSGGTPARA